jgi:UDP-GlcNAc:undecaprenyl-phosphate/decaprenyl-phosphate GlcNAc-1-phosphate transferase
MDSSFQIIASAGSALIIATVLMPIILKISHHFRWYADKDPRKIHTNDLPHIGGTGVFIAATLAVVLHYLLDHFIFNLGDASFIRFLPLLIAFFVIHVTGLIDDFTDMHARYKFVIQFATAAVVAFMGYTIRVVELPWLETTIRLGPAAYLITILWLAGTSNAINFIDGIDGLAGGISAIAASAYGVVFLIIGSYTSAFIAFAMLGALVGFLLFNRPPAKIIMGDCGAIYLGFFLGSLPLLEHSETTTLLGIAIPFSLLLFPVLDTLMSIVRRLRRKISIVKPDREHIHHKLLDLGLSQRQILVITYALEALPCAAVIVWAATGNHNFFWLVLATWIIMLAFFIILDVIYHRKEWPLPESFPES